MSKRSASRSTILPLPSSPHWAPITAITLDISSETGHFLVQLDVFVRGSFPGIVDYHSVVLNLLPLLGPRIKVKCFAYFFKQSARFVRSKLETGAAAVCRIELLDRVVETTRRPHDRNRAVTHAVHLIQTARLIQRRHEKHVSARFDLMGQRFTGETLVNADAMRGRVVPTLQKVFVLLRARTQGDEERSGIANRTRDLTNQIVAFLAHEARDDRDDGSLRFLRQIKATQQIDFALALT